MTAEDIPGVLPGGSLVKAGTRPEEADPERDALVLKAIAQHRKQAGHLAGIVEGLTEFADGIHLVLGQESGPLLGLGGLNEGDEGVHI